MKGWFTSFTEDMLFFGTGFLGLVITTRLLRDEAFETRISSLTNGKNMNKRVEKFFRREVEQLLSYNTYRTTTLEVERIDKDNKNIFIHVEMKWRIVNMCEDQKVPARIRGLVEPGEKIEGELGYVFLHSLTPELQNRDPMKNNNLQTFFLLREGHTLNLNDLKGNTYDIGTEYYIDENSAVNMTLSFAIWVPVDGDIDKDRNWFFDGFSGYTENYSLRIENQLNVDLFYRFNDLESHLMEGFKDRAPKNNKVEKNSALQTIASNLVFLKGDKLKIFFTLH